jgi:hypothetical protein
MGRGLRSDTAERIALARQDSPLSMGPMFGELATHFNISGGMVAALVNAHEQTVLRWFFGRSEMTPAWIKASVKLFAVLTWMYTANKDPLSGSNREKTAQLALYIKEFNELANI